MSGPRRRRYYDRWEVEEYRLREAERAHREKLESGEWEIGEDDISWLLGPTLVRVKKTEEE